jgi:hypothetical protein
MANSNFVFGNFVQSVLELTTTADTAFTLRDANQNPISMSLYVGYRIVVDSLIVTNGATAQVLTIYIDKNGNGTYDAGEELIIFDLAANQVASVPHGTFTGVVLGTVASGVGLLRAVEGTNSTPCYITMSGRLTQG